MSPNHLRRLALFILLFSIATVACRFAALLFISSPDPIPFSLAEYSQSPRTISPVQSKHWLFYEGIGSKYCDMAVDKDGIVWVGVITALHRLDPVDGSVQSYTNIIETSMTADSQGRVWIGLLGQGLLRMDGEEGGLFPATDGLFYDAPPLLAAGNAGDMWAFVTDSEQTQTALLYIEETGRITARKAPPWANSMAVDADGSLWMSTDEGIVRFSEPSYTRMTQNLAEVESWTTIAAAPDGATWFGTEDDGVFRFDGTNWTHYGRDEGLPGVNITAIAVSQDGKVWVSAGTRGLAVYDGETWQTFEREDGLGASVVRKISVALNGDVWVCTNLGVARYQP